MLLAALFRFALILSDNLLKHDMMIPYAVTGRQEKSPRVVACLLTNLTKEQAPPACSNRSDQCFQDFLEDMSKVSAKLRL